MDDDFLIALCIGMLGVFIGFMVGLACGNPSELENECIMHDHKIYCEEVKQ